MLFDPKKELESAEVVPAGEYLVEITSAKKGESAKKKTPYLSFRFKVLTGEQKNRSFWQNFYLTEKSFWKLATLMKAIGDLGAIDLDDLKAVKKVFLKKRLFVVLSVEEYEGQKRDIIDQTLPLTDEQVDLLASIPVQTVGDSQSSISEEQMVDDNADNDDDFPF